MTDVPAMLRTYLQDHHAGSTAGLELARRTAGSNADTEYGAELARIADEIAADRETLEQVMDAARGEARARSRTPPAGRPRSSAG